MPCFLILFYVMNLTVQDAQYNVFTNPYTLPNNTLANRRDGYLEFNPVWLIGSRHIISWESNLTIYNITLWQEGLHLDGCRLDSTIFGIYSLFELNLIAANEDIIGLGESTDFFIWTVELSSNTSLPHSNIFFFWVNWSSSNWLTDNFQSRWINISDMTSTQAGSTTTLLSTSSTTSSIGISILLSSSTSTSSTSSLHATMSNSEIINTLPAPSVTMSTILSATTSTTVSKSFSGLATALSSVLPSSQWGSEKSNEPKVGLALGLGLGLGVLIILIVGYLLRRRRRRGRATLWQSPHSNARPLVLPRTWPDSSVRTSDGPFELPAEEIAAELPARRNIEVAGLRT